MKLRSALVVNSDAAVADPPEAAYAEVVVNFAPALLRNEKMDGQDYLVCPMVMICEGVVPGSQGPLMYHAEELAKFPGVWNHKPVVVYHPMMNGLPVSACEPAVVDACRVGIIMNTVWDEKAKKLRAEAWLNEAKLQQVDARVLTAIKAGNMVEVSTGLFTDNVPVANGTWQGESYTAEARNLRPDHLAILPDQKGACGIDRGAGLLQINAKGMSFEDLHDKADKKLRLQFGDSAYAVALYNKTIVYRAHGKLWEIGYTVDKDDVKFAEGMPTEVQRKVAYVPATTPVTTNTGDNQPGKGEIAMKEKIIAALIANSATAWDEEDRSYLESLDEDRLQKMVPVANTEPAPEKEKEASKEPAAEANPAEAPAEPVANKQGEAPKQPVTVNEYIATAPPEIREVLQAGVAAAARDRKALIETITANANNPFTAEELAAKSLGELHQLKQLAGSAAPAQPAQPNAWYGVTPAPEPVANNAPAVEPMAIPQLDFTNTK